MGHNTSHAIKNALEWASGAIEKITGDNETTKHPRESQPSDTCIDCPKSNKNEQSHNGIDANGTPKEVPGKMGVSGHP
jgi:hypothetical protein